MSKSQKRPHKNEETIFGQPFEENQPVFVRQEMLIKNENPSNSFFDMNDNNSFSDQNWPKY